MNSLPLSEAKDHLTRLVHEAEEGQAVQLTRHGKPAAVVIGIAEYGRLSERAEGTLSRFEAWRRAWGGAILGGDDELHPAFEGLRSPESGRAAPFNR